MKVQIMRVGPELAAKWLATLHPLQRTLRKPHVQFLAGLMRRGEFTVNGDPIRFDKDSRLVDGQHRLQAVVLAGDAAAFTFCWPMGAEAVQSLAARVHAGKARDAQDVAHLIRRVLAEHGGGGSGEAIARSKRLVRAIVADLDSESLQMLRTVETPAWGFMQRRRRQSMGQAVPLASR